MAGLKSFLHQAAPILGVSPAALYERQRALINLGVLKTVAGRGPGSGVPFTAENFAAVLISLLAADSLSKVGSHVADLCTAPPLGAMRRTGWRPPHWDDATRSAWTKLGKPTFVGDVGLVLSGEWPPWLTKPQQPSFFSGLRVTRSSWRGQIVAGHLHQPISYLPVGSDKYIVGTNYRISITAEIEEDMLTQLIKFTKATLSQARKEESKE
jgi:hypothetical protein